MAEITRVTQAGINIVAVPSYPFAPTLTVTPLPGELAIQTSAYVPSPAIPDDEHVETTYELTDTGDPDFLAPSHTLVYGAPSPGLEFVLVDGLGGLTTYLVRALHTGLVGGDSPWSLVVQETTLDDVTRADTPTAVVLDVGVDWVSATTTAFSHPDGETTAEDFDPANPLPYLSAAQFQIRRVSTGLVVSDSGLFPVAADPPLWFDGDLLDDEAYQIRALHYDGYHLASSAWSAWLAFATLAIPLEQPDAPALTITASDPNGTVSAATAAFSHPDPLATHTATRWRAQVSGSGDPYLTTDPAELLAFVWTSLGPGIWVFDAAHRDDSGRWSDYGASDTYTVPAQPSPVVLNHSGSIRLCANTLLTWDTPQDTVTVWRFHAQLSADDGATWSDLFTNRTTKSYTFNIAGRPDGVYLFRIRTKDPALAIWADWAYMVLHIDRTCSKTTVYDLSEVTDIAIQHPDWEVIWNDDPADVTWTPVDQWGDAGGGFGILANALPLGAGETYQAVQSNLVFTELGEPTLFDAEVEFVVFGTEWRHYMWKWGNVDLSRGGLAFAARGYDGDLPLTKKGIAQWANTGIGVNGCPDYDKDCPGDCWEPPCKCRNTCSGGNACQCYWCISALWHLNNLYPAQFYDYAWASRPGAVRHMSFRPDYGVHTSYAEDSTHSEPRVDGRTHGLRVSTAHGCSLDDHICCWYHPKYILRQKVRRTVTGGILIQTQILGPGLDPEIGWTLEKEMSYAQVQAIGCGNIGLAFNDVRRSPVTSDYGILFTSFSITPLEYDECIGPPAPPTPAPSPNPEIGDVAGRPCAVILFVYNEDRTTVKWQVGDYREHPNPYLCLLDNYGEQEVDPVGGGVTIGQVEVVVVDRRQIAGDQDSGWLTERLGVSTVGAIHGRRCRVLRYISPTLGWVVIADGPASTPMMDESYSAFRWVVKDTRETERKVRAFVKADTSWLLPMGVEGGFGAYTDGDGADQWLVSPAEPLIGDYHYDTGETWPVGWVDFYDYWTFAGFPFLGDDVVDPAVVVIPKSEELFIADADALGDPRPVLWTWPELEILWRPQGSADPWTVVQPTDLLLDGRVNTGPAGSGPFWRNLVNVWDALLADDSEVRAVSAMTLRGFQATGTWPADGDLIEIAIRYAGEPSEEYPRHIHGMTSGEFLKKLYDGEYSPRDPVTGAIVPTAIRYNETDLLRMGGGVAFISLGSGLGSIALASGAGRLLMTTSPTAVDRVLLRQTEVVDDLRAWAEEHVYSPTGWFPSLNNDGEISPRNQVPPDDFSGLLQITNPVTEPQPDWDAGERIVNVLTYKYPRWLPVEVEDAEAVDGLIEREITIEYRDEASITRHAIQAVTYDGDTFSAIGDASGAPIISLATEQGKLLTELRRLYVFDRYRNAAVTIQVPVMREYCALIRAGDWVVVDLSWFPDYITKRRGLLTGCQVLAVYDVDCAWRILLLEEAFPITEES